MINDKIPAPVKARKVGLAEGGAKFSTAADPGDGDQLTIDPTGAGNVSARVVHVDEGSFGLSFDYDDDTKQRIRNTLESTQNAA